LRKWIAVWNQFQEQYRVDDREGRDLLIRALDAKDRLVHADNAATHYQLSLDTTEETMDQYNRRREVRAAITEEATAAYDAAMAALVPRDNLLS
jgi:hypothetical protein